MEATMPREDWRDRETERLRGLRDRDRDDFGQADYSNRYGYDPRTRTGYRTFEDGRPYPAEPQRGEARAVGPLAPDPRQARRDGPSDRVMWAVIMERLHDERRLDLRDVEVDVHDGEVTLNGTVRHKADKRRIEDIADIEGVHNVQNNLRPAERSRRWTFL